MSSQQFMDTFDGAATFIRSKYALSEDVSKYLEFLRGTLANTSATSPVDDPNLSVEPIVDSQLAGVSLDSARNVVSELRRFHLLNYWVRATCPVSDANDVIVETDKVAEFREIVEGACPFCGNSHEDIDWGNVQLFLAFNFDVVQRRLSIGELVQRPPDFTGEPRNPLHRACGWALSFFAQRDGSPASKIERALASNRPATSPPSAADCITLLWGLSLKFAGVALVICCLTYFCFGGALALGMVAIAIAMYVLLMWYSLSAMRSGTALERGVSWSSFGIATGLFVHGTTGLKVTGNLQDFRSVKFEFGEVDYVAIVAGVICFLGGQLIAQRIAHDRMAFMTSV